MFHIESVSLFTTLEVSQSQEPSVSLLICPLKHLTHLRHSTNVWSVDRLTKKPVKTHQLWQSNKIPQLYHNRKELSHVIFIFLFLPLFLSFSLLFFLYIIVFRLKIAKPNQLSWEVNSQVYDVLKIPWTSQGTGLGSKDIHIFTPWEYFSERGGCS